MPQSSGSVSPKCSATCRCLQRARLGEADEPVGPRQRLPLVAGEERRRSAPRESAGGSGTSICIARPGVEAALHEPDLLQHPDEDARVGFVARAPPAAPRAGRAAARRPARRSATVGMSERANRRSWLASERLASSSVSDARPSRPARPTIWT